MEINRTNSLNEHVLKCPICYELFSQIYKPLIIPCGHTICSRCVEQLKKLGSEDYDNSYNSNLDEASISLESDSDDETEEENEEEDNQSDESVQDQSMNTNRDEDSENNIIEIIEQKDNIVKRDKEKHFNLQCSICRKKMRIKEEDIILNNNVLKFINMMNQNENKNKLILNNDKKIYCNHCKIIDNENDHASKHQVTDNILNINDNEFNNLKNLSFNSYQDYDLITILKEIINNIYDSNEMKSGKDYLINNFKMYSRTTYLKNKSFKNLSKLYSRFEEHLDKSDYRKAELCMNKSKDILEKYYFKINNFLNLQEKVINRIEHDKQIILDLAIKYLQNGFLKAYNNNIFSSEKRYLTNVDRNEDSVFIYDLRLKDEIYIPYEKIFESICVENNSNTDEKQIYYTTYTEIDNDGRFLFLLGKREQVSKKFRIYDLLNRELINKPNIPRKFRSFDSIFYNNLLFILGGSITHSQLSKDCYYYDLDAEYWFDFPSLNIDRYNKSICVHNNAFYIFGGNSSSEESNHINFNFEYLDLNNPYEWNTISIKNFNPTNYNSFYGFISENIFIILGGEDRINDEESNKGYLIDINKREMIEQFEINKNFICFKTCANYRNLLVGAIPDQGKFSKFDINHNLYKLKTII